MSFSKAGARVRNGDVDDLIHHAHAHGFFDRVLGGEKAVDVRRAHAEFYGDVGHRRLAIAGPPEMLLGPVPSARS